MTAITWEDVPSPRADNGSERITVQGIDYTDEMNALGYFLVRDGEVVIDREVYGLTDDEIAWLLGDAEPWDETLTGDAYDAYWATVNRINAGDYRTEAQVAADEDGDIAVNFDDELAARRGLLTPLVDWVLDKLAAAFPSPEWVGSLTFDDAALLDTVPAYTVPIEAADQALADAGFIFTERAVILNALATALPGLFDVPAPWVAS